MYGNWVPRMVRLKHEINIKYRTCIIKPTKHTNLIKYLVWWCYLRRILCCAAVYLLIISYMWDPCFGFLIIDGMGLIADMCPKIPWFEGLNHSFVVLLCSLLYSFVTSWWSSGWKIGSSRLEDVLEILHQQSVPS